MTWLVLLTDRFSGLQGRNHLLEERVEALEKRIEELEDKKHMGHCYDCGALLRCHDSCGRF